MADAADGVCSSERESWGRYPKARHVVRHVSWPSDVLPLESDGRACLPFGRGRSYGDVCLNDNGVLLDTSRFNRFISFDKSAGTLSCEAGVPLVDILNLIVPHDFFIPVTPGTKFVSVGGAIANDVHGKNHHRAGTFGCHVLKFELLRSDGRRLICSPRENPEWFRATIGGLGLTGLILWAEFKLKPIRSALIDWETVKFSDLREFLDLSRESDERFDYVVAWMDCLAAGSALGRGLLMRGNHAQTPALRPSPGVKRAPSFSLPFDAPEILLNTPAVRAFNLLYYRKQLRKTVRRLTHFDPFFYPLDSIGRWNRLYGKRGFLQYQCVIPSADGGDQAVKSVLETVSKSGLGPFLAVVKLFGGIPSPGMMSFPRKGVTLALDFPNRGQETLRLLGRLDEIVGASRGAVYPAKDACMSPAGFASGYPRWREFSKYIDPRFSSNFWRRVTSE